MAEKATDEHLLEGYRAIPEEEQKKATRFFDYGKTVSDSGQFDYAIELYIQGLGIDPEAVEQHRALREISLKRKASGGKPLGFMAANKLKSSKDDKQNMLNAEKLLAFDPGNTDRMVDLIQSAHRAGFYDTVMWIGPILQKANADSKSPDFNKFIILKDIYKSIKRFKEATEACHHAIRLRPDDMELLTEEKNLGALRTMHEGKYGSSKSFRESIKDMDAQGKLIEGDKDVRSLDSLRRGIAEAEAEWKSDLNEVGKLLKYVEALLRTEQTEDENRAIDVLEEAFQRTKQFRFRHKIGQIKLAQLTRMERSMAESVKAEPNNADLKKQFAQFRREKVETELAEFQLWSENYPTDTRFRHEVAKRLFVLGQFNEAIPVFQVVRNDPKLKGEATVYLGRAFLESGFVEEAVDTFRNAIEEHPTRSDQASRQMYYFYGRALEQKGDNASALKAYSQVAQWDFNYADVQARIKRLRTTPAPQAPQTPQV